MRSIEATGTSLNQAIQNGLKELGKTEEEVNVTILTMGGLFNKYKVLLTEIPPIEKEQKLEQSEEINLQPKAKVKSPDEQPEMQETNIVLKNIDPEAPEKIEMFLRELFNKMNISARFIISADEQNINISIRSEEDSAKLIGKHGDTIKSLQQICYAVLSQQSTDNRRICVDVDNYRNKRDEILVSLAYKTARRVAKNKKKIALEPMNSYERRIIHNALQNDRFCTSYSEGKEPNRHIVIDLK